MVSPLSPGRNHRGVGESGHPPTPTKKLDGPPNFLRRGLVGVTDCAKLGIPFYYPRPRNWTPNSDNVVVSLRSVAALQMLDADQSCSNQLISRCAPHS